MIQDNRAAEIAAQLRARIAELPAGTRLPGVRALSSEFSASAATVSAALAQLTALGLMRAEPGRGTFVLDRSTQREPDFTWQTQALGGARIDPDRAARLGGYGGADHLPLSWGYLAPELTPAEELQRIAARAGKHQRAWAMTPPTGSPELRRVLAAPYRADPSEVLVTAGGQQALVFAMRTLAEPGATLITESPSYPGAILAAQSSGLRLAPVPSDADGILVDRLEDELRRTGARLVYLQPGFANPTGATLSPERRARVLELAAAYGAFIIEDDWARHLGIDAPTPPPLFTAAPDGHVVSVLTLAKPASPGLRLGALVARGPAAARLRASRTAEDLGVAPLVQETALGLLTSSAWPRHLARLAPALAERRDALLAALAESVPAVRVVSVPRGGLHVWARLPLDADTGAVCAAADAAGVLVGNGAHFFVDEPPAAHLRFSYGAGTPAQFAEGARRLGALLAGAPTHALKEP
ncbi:PLP-dependent aminotransferase family protein [Leucobacter chromiireducens]|uniref:aminotransferase-like domain-containing protein n=1 Tax=Leucobacter chromiireducens TaxID=283877 RepID=UPI000F630F23|nr:PLP-dependent aminotransferase family protein [Leucobacter chromiireducens]